MALSPFSFYLAGVIIQPGVENSARMIFLFMSGFETKQNKVFRRRSHDFLREMPLSPTKNHP
jgi:hypothetical protein